MGRQKVKQIPGHNPVMTQRSLADDLLIRHQQKEICNLKKRILELEKLGSNDLEISKKNEELTRLQLDLHKYRREAEANKGKILMPLSYVGKSDVKAPVQQLLDVGNLIGKKIILYCEGTYQKRDYKVYSICYPEALVIPTGSWTSVQRSVCDTMKSQYTYGIIGRNNRGVSVRDALRANYVFLTQVKSVENLFATDQFLLILIRHFKIAKPKTTIKRMKAEAVHYFREKEGRYMAYDKALIEFPPNKVINFIESFLGLSEKTGIVGSYISELLEKGNKNMLRKAFTPYLPQIV